MCSTAAERIAEIGQAIDDLAEQAGAEQAAPRARGITQGSADPIVTRVAELWALLAELDPEITRRLAGYQALATPAD